MKKTLLALALAFQISHGSNFPDGLSQIEVGHIVKAIGIGAATRMLRSADPYDLFPGIKFGLECALVPSIDVNGLGQANGTLPGLNLLPRFFMSKGLFLDLELIFSFIPTNIINTISTYGVGLKWTFSREQEKYASLAMFLNYTGISAFSGSYTGGDVELGIMAGKDYVRLKPYIGLGLLFAYGSVSPGLMRAGQQYNNTEGTIHIFMGSEIELPINIAFQIDLMNLTPMGSIFLGKKF